MHTEILRLLVAAGANVNIADREGVRRYSTQSGVVFARWSGYWKAAGAG